MEDPPPLVLMVVHGSAWPDQVPRRQVHTEIQEEEESGADPRCGLDHLGHRVDSHRSLSPAARRRAYFKAKVYIYIYIYTLFGYMDPYTLNPAVPIV